MGGSGPIFKIIIANCHINQHTMFKNKSPYSHGHQPQSRSPLPPPQEPPVSSYMFSQTLAAHNANKNKIMTPTVSSSNVISTNGNGMAIGGFGGLFKKVVGGTGYGTGNGNGNGSNGGPVDLDLGCDEVLIKNKVEANQAEIDFTCN